ncbi:MAG TPA: glycosyltransferase [Puia sp.]|jgi:glycosyltransferase involved in cell wall biosynthesis|nr:glycosyltransferase [Puia sp.]
MTKICIVTTRHISYNPRVLKEADALSAAGYEVVVVTVSNSDRQAAFDEELMKRRSWRLRTVNFRRERSGERRYWVYLSLKQRAFLAFSRVSYGGGIAERAAEKAYDALAALATAEKADLYIAHHAEALGAAWRAARRTGARFGFDAEDFHTGMNEAGTVSAQDKLVEYLESKYLPHVVYMTAASKGIGEAYRKKYGLRQQPVTILNVFPYEELPVGEPGDPVKFYWYSQVIGPNRGIELLLEAASRVRLPFEIHLRGSMQSEAYRDRLKELCGSSGLWDRIVLHEPILAERLIGEANRYDVGLALESDISFNRNICVTNKTFAYLMSRLVLLGTDTEGQKDIFSFFPDATRIFRMNDAAGLAAEMEFLILHKDVLISGKQAAAKAVRDSFNWELESQKLLGYIKEALCQPS